MNKPRKYSKKKIPHNVAFCKICFFCFGCYPMPFVRITKGIDSVIICMNCYGKFEDIDMYRKSGYFYHVTKSNSKSFAPVFKDNFMFPNFETLKFEWFENTACCNVEDPTIQ